MAMLLTKAYAIPTIKSVRSTCIGEQYTVVTPEFTDIVTVNGERATCTCHAANCEHVSVVTRQRTFQAAQDALRTAYYYSFEV